MTLDDYLDLEPQFSVAFDEEKISPSNFLALEGLAHRRALTLIKSKLHPDRLQDLVAPEIEESDRRFAALESSWAEGYREASAEAYVDNIDMTRHGDWFFGRNNNNIPWPDWTPLRAPCANTDRPEMVLGHPEHYRLTTLPDHRQYEVETVGGLPVCWLIQISGDLPDIGAESTEWPRSNMAGLITLRNGTIAARAGHRRVLSGTGMRARFAVQYAHGASDSIFESMRRHLAVEFNLWLTMSKISQGALPGALNDYISGGHGIRWKVNGEEISQDLLLRWEVSAMRRALTLLRARLTPDAIEDLLGAETAAFDQGAAEQTPAHEAEMTFEAQGISASDFWTWFTSGAPKKAGRWSNFLQLPDAPIANSDSPVFLLAHPEHFRMSDAPGGMRQVISVNGLPTRRNMQPIDDASPIDAGGAYSIVTRTMGNYSRNGALTHAVQFLFRDTPSGFAGRVVMTFPAGSAKALVRSEQERLAITFKNWIAMAKWERTHA